METGALTGYIDVAQVVLYAFWVFFAGLVFYLRREDKREGYPLDSDRTERTDGLVKVVGFPSPPPPKTFQLVDGRTVTKPEAESFSRPQNLESAFPWTGSPWQPTGDGLGAGVGAGAFVERPDVVDQTLEGKNRFVPMRSASEYSVSEGDPDPRGMPVVALDGEIAGTVTDIWVERTEMRALFLELELAAGAKPAKSKAKGEEGKAESVLLPINFARVEGRHGRVRVVSITAEQFAGVPRLRDPNQMTMLEEEKIAAYYGGGHIYAHPMRQEPLL